MPTGAVILVRLKEEIPGDELARLRQQIKGDLGLEEEDFYADGPLVRVSDRNSGPLPLTETLGHWFSLNILRSYYGPGYRRGDLPLFIRCAEWIERNLPQSEVWYGHDVDDANITRFDLERRAQFMRDYESHSFGG